MRNKHKRLLEGLASFYVFLIALLLLLLYLNTEACTPFLIQEEELLVEEVAKEIIIYEIKKGEHNYKEVTK